MRYHFTLFTEMLPCSGYYTLVVLPFLLSYYAVFLLTPSLVLDETLNLRVEVVLNSL